MNLKELARAAAPLGVEARRWLHQHPELGFQERETSAYVAARLTELGYRPEVGVGGGYGVKAILRGARPGPTIALRADMDALPITEATGLPYSSQNPGVMHACGHDVHTGTLLAAAKALKQLQPELAGNVVFIFQPAEEIPPGGAVGMIEAGVLNEPRVDAIFGMHIDPGLPAGQMSFAAGPVNAAPDSFDIRIQGRGGHGAAPHQTIDAVLIGAQVVGALQHIHSRQINPFDQLVITVGRFEGGTTRNVIADQALLQGTVRTTSPQLRAGIEEMIRRIVAGVCSTYGATFELKYDYGYPVLVNDEAMTDLARQAAIALVGDGAVQRAQPGMYGEDFAYYLQERPGCFGNLGVKAPGDGPTFPCHHPKLTVSDELGIETGVGFYLELVARFLAS